MTLRKDSVVPDLHEIGKRNVKKVPFVELFNNTLQGVVSASSDPARVYVSYIHAESGEYYCSTNHNRECNGGLYYGPCKHIQSLVKEAVAQYGAPRVSRYMRLDIDHESADDKGINAALRSKGSVKRNPSSAVFSRFLYYLQQLEAESSSLPMPEMAWFVSG